jgi:aminopeptidase N
MNYSTEFEFENAYLHFNQDRDFKLEHFNLDITLPDIENINQADAEIELILTSFRKNTKGIQVDAKDMNIEFVIVNGEKIDFSYDKKVIDIAFPKSIREKIDFKSTLHLKIKYQIIDPNQGLYFVRPNIDHPDVDIQLWTQGESDEIASWIPTFNSPNHVCTNKKTITVSKPFKAYSNGILLDKNTESNTYIWDNNIPQPIYLNAIYICEADVKLYETDLGIEVGNILNKKYEHLQNDETMKKLPEMISFLENFYQFKYPHQKYYQAWADEFIWGGMENTSLTINSSRQLGYGDEMKEIGYAEKLILHELAHQWFGNTIIINHWEELWIKEGGAIFAEIIWERYSKGKNEGDYYRYNTMRDYLSDSNRRPTMINYYFKNDDLYDLHSYDKAGLVYSLIEKSIGSEKLISDFLSNFLTQNKFQNVGFQDLVKSALITTGKNIKPYLDQYLFRAGHPICTFTSFWNPTQKLFKFKINQKQYKEKEKLATLFTLENIEIDFFYIKEKDGVKEVEKITKLVNIEEPEETFHFNLEQKPDFVTLDSENYFIFEQEFQFSEEEIKNIIQYHPSTIARINALKFLEKNQSLENLEFLKNLYKESQEYFIRIEIVETLSKFKFNQVVNALLEIAQNESNGLVLANIYSKLGEYKNKDAYEFILSRCRKHDKSILAEKVAYTTLGKLAQKIDDSELIKNAYNFLTQQIQNFNNWQDNSVVMGIVAGVGHLWELEKAFEFTLNQVKRGNKFYLARFSAIKSLANFFKNNNEKWNVKIFDALEEMSQENSFDTQRYLIAFLPLFKDYRSIAILKSIKLKSKHYRIQKSADKAMESIISSLKEKETNVKLFKDLEKKNEELKSIKSEMADLKKQFEAMNKQFEKINKKQETENNPA